MAEIGESGGKSSDPTVLEKVCKERVKRIEQLIESSYKGVENQMGNMTNAFEDMIENNKIIEASRELEMQNLRTETSTLNNQIASLLQWKINGERQEDVWYKRQTVKTGILIIVVGIISNLDKLLPVLKNVAIALNGGKP